MLRRRFIQLATLAGAGGLVTAETITAAHNHSTVVFNVKGFTCVTCAVGLDTVLMRQDGIVSSNSSYPEGKVTVCHEPNRITEKAIRAFIADAGFTVRDEHNA